MPKSIVFNIDFKCMIVVHNVGFLYAYPSSCLIFNSIESKGSQYHKLTSKYVQDTSNECMWYILSGFEYASPSCCLVPIEPVLADPNNIK